MNPLKFIAGLGLPSVGKAFGLRSRIGKTDLGVLKVAFMIAALDGEVSSAEYRAFDRLLKRCRGCTEKSAAAAFDEAMRSGGYLLLQASRLGEAGLEKAFVAEARAALPDGFAYFEFEDVRRAMAIWIAMAMSDGDYSPRERRCIEALRRMLAEMRLRRAREMEDRALALSPAYRQVRGVSGGRASAAPTSRDAVARLERLMAKLGDSEDAARELKELIAGGAVAGKQK